LDNRNNVTDKKAGKRTFVFSSHPEITGAASIAGVKEGKGPQAEWFDLILQDDYYGEKTFEKAESKMLRSSINMALENAHMQKQSLDVLLSGDLINQLMSSSYMARDIGVPYLGLYGACSTMTQSMLLAALMVDGGYVSNAAAAASSHFATAERQFRMPLEHGNQRPPQAQWTSTASGSVIIEQNSYSDTQKRHICVTHGTVGRVIDPGIRDTNSMGSAMAPAAYDTIRVHLADLNRTPHDYDLILTGDLGRVGKWILLDFADGQLDGFENVYEDCGAVMYDDSQDTHAGGSGCGCSASLIAGRIIKELRAGRYRRVMLVSTGALISTISKQQGETVPGIAHAVTLEVF
jgi:stage V sporulation protein AD